MVICFCAETAAFGASIQDVVRGRLNLMNGFTPSKSGAHRALLGFPQTDIVQIIATSVVI